MAMGGIGVSLAGFAGLLAAFHKSHQAEPAVFRWRIREIVNSSVQIIFLGFGTVALYEVWSNPAAISRIITFTIVALWVVGTFRFGGAGPAWPDELERLRALAATWVWITLFAINVIVGSVGYLMLIFVAYLIRPAAVFVKAVNDVARATSESDDFEATEEEKAAAAGDQDQEASE